MNTKDIINNSDIKLCCKCKYANFFDDILNLDVDLDIISHQKESYDINEQHDQNIYENMFNEIDIVYVEEIITYR